EFHDPDALCPDAICLVIKARSAADQKNDIRARDIPAKDAPLDTGGRRSLTIDLSRLSASRPDPVFARFELKGPGYWRSIPESEYLRIPNNPDPWYEKGWFLSLATLVGGSLVLFGILFVKPRWVLGLVTRPALLDAAPKSGIPGVGDLVIGLLRSL